MNQHSADINLRYAAQALRRRLPIFLLCLVLVPVTALGLSLLQEKEYTSKASLLFRDPQFDQKLFGSSFVQSSGDPAREAATNVELVSLEKVAALTAKRLRTLSPEEVSEAVAVTSEGQSDVVSIEATGSSAAQAAKLANTFTERYIAFRRDADRDKIKGAQAPLRRQLKGLSRKEREGRLGQSLAQRLNELSVLASLQTGNAELVQPAQVPEGASSPNLPLNAALGLGFGLVLGIALVVLAEALDRRLRDPAEVEQAFERGVLAALPESEALSNPDPALINVPDAEREAFRMLHANLKYFSLSRDIRSVLVTSADSGDGKSTVAWGLAVAAATGASRTLLVEADLRQPSFAARYKLRPRRGLTGVLTGEVDRSAAVTTIDLTPGDRRGPERSMDVLLAGPLPPNPTDLLQSEQMARLLRESGDNYDLVIIDTPPAVSVSDAIPLLTMVGGVIVVSRLGKTTRDHLRRLRHQLEHLDAPVLGLVVNSVNRGGAYGYGYGYGYGSASTSAQTNLRSRTAEAEDLDRAGAPSPTAPPQSVTSTAAEESSVPTATSQPGAAPEAEESEAATRPEGNGSTAPRPRSVNGAPPRPANTGARRPPQTVRKRLREWLE